MIADEQDRILNEAYADLLVEFDGDFTVFERFENATVRIINYLYAVVHIPAEQVTLDLISEWGYSILPNCFGILSEASIEASSIQRIRTVPNFNLRGQGVLLGFIDTGIDYLNPGFQYADGMTRIVSIWDQTIDSNNYPETFMYGTEYSREEINLALASENPLEIVPSIDIIGHGTMLAGIAAGNEAPESNFYGIATDSELLVVKLKQAKRVLREFFVIPEEAVCYSEIDILYGLYYVMIGEERALFISEDYADFIDTLGIKNYLIRGARRSKLLTYPNRDWGYGILDVFNTFDVLRGIYR